MAKRNRNILKSFYEAFDKPTAAEFADLIDSVLNFEDDALFTNITFAPVKDRRFTPPTLTNSKNRHIIISSATGAWLGREGQIAQDDGTQWTFQTPIDGSSTTALDENRIQFIYNSSNNTWEPRDIPSFFQLKGEIDASTNPNYPTAEAGDAYLINTTGKIGGIVGENVKAGDFILAKVDTPPGNQATVGINWIILRAEKPVISKPFRTDTFFNVLSNITNDEEPTGLTLTKTPDGDLDVEIDSISIKIGDGVKTKDCYFSMDGGLSARNKVDIQAGDELIFNAIIAGFILTTTMNVHFKYNAV